MKEFLKFNSTAKIVCKVRSAHTRLTSTNGKSMERGPKKEALKKVTPIECIDEEKTKEKDGEWF